MKTVFVARDLIKSHGDLKAVDGISFKIHENEIFVLAFLGFAAIFSFIPSVVRLSRSADAIGIFIYFPAMFFSGLLIPLDILPIWIVGYISPFIPVTYAVELMQGLWLGTTLLDLTREVFILLGVLCLGLVITACIFRWE